jgi:hypothetical protein
LMQPINVVSLHQQRMQAVSSSRLIYVLACDRNDSLNLGVHSARIFQLMLYRQKLFTTESTESTETFKIDSLPSRTGVPPVFAARTVWTL